MKKIVVFISMILVLLLSLTFMVAVSADDTGSALYYGDTDLNYSVNVKDATLIQKHLAMIVTLDETQLLCADADLSEAVNIKDATVIQKHVAMLPQSYPVGEPIIGGDPTEPGTTTPSTTQPEEKMDTNITIYFSNNVGWSTVNAYLYNESVGVENASWPGVAMTLHGTNDFGEKIYKMEVDVSVYNRVVFNNGKSQTMNASLSVASSGFYITSQTPKSGMQLGIYAFEEANYGKMETVNLDYPDGYQKPIYIWTPNGYDPEDTSKEYKVIYLLDGQNQFLDHSATAFNGIWATDKTVTSLQHNGGEGIILVGIDNSRNRDNELTPDIGPIIPQYAYGGFLNGTGERFSDFVADTVMPYICENYNVSDKPEDNAIAGSSSGGLEAFYIGMEHMDKFGNIGSLSPAFMLFDKADWDKYLDKFDFSNPDELPRIYFYNGGGDSLEVELNPYAKAMPQWMEALGYPSDKMIFAYEEKNQHNETAWRCVMPEIVTWLFELQ